MTVPIELMERGVTGLCPVRSAVTASLPRLLRWIGLLTVLAFPFPALTADGLPIHSAELHSTRIPREHWQHRLQMARALGLNTVSTMSSGAGTSPSLGSSTGAGRTTLPGSVGRPSGRGCSCSSGPGPMSVPSMIWEGCRGGNGVHPSSKVGEHSHPQAAQDILEGQLTKNSISSGPHELRRQLDHGRQKSLCWRHVASRRRGLLVSFTQLLGVLPFHLFLLHAVLPSQSLPE